MLPRSDETSGQCSSCRLQSITLYQTAAVHCLPGDSRSRRCQTSNVKRWSLDIQSGSGRDVAITRAGACVHDVDASCSADGVGSGSKAKITRGSRKLTFIGREEFLQAIPFKVSTSDKFLGAVTRKYSFVIYQALCIYLQSNSRILGSFTRLVQVHTGESDKVPFGETDSGEGCNQLV